ncbi:MAG: hypothetical protein M1820_002147 [Bogoriella megaspora]|nr:MAG: hypothetical protein M1820_002147 [Bogoriella megaspora]
MLSRATSDAGNRLRKARSSTSNHSKHLPTAYQPLDPLTARQHAEAAAATAYGRAHGTAQLCQSDVSRHKSNASGKSQGSHLQHHRTSGRSSLDRGPSRRISTRDNSGPQPVTPSNVPIEMNTIVRAENYVKASYQLEVQNTPEENLDTEPSSFRKLRKARSLFGPNDAQPIDEVFEGPKHISPEDQDRRRLGLRKSKFSFDTSQMTEIPVPDKETPPKDEVVDRERVTRARDKLFQQLHTRRLRESTSFLALSKSFKRRQDNQVSPHEHERAVTYDSNLPLPRLTRPSPPSTSRIRDKARVLSAPLTNSFKRLLRKTSSSNSSEVPDQQREASKLYFERPKGPDEFIFQQSSPAPEIPRSPSDSSATHVKRYNSALGDLGAVGPQDNTQMSGCNESGSVNTRSRVTSWSDSTVEDTAGASISQRLPVIEEHENILEPASFYETTSSSLNNRNIFKRRASNKSEKDDKGHRSASHRVYSALMKKIGQEGLDDNDSPPPPMDQPSHTKSALDTLPSRKHGSTISKISRLSKGTIRAVTPDSYTVNTDYPSNNDVFQEETNPVGQNNGDRPSLSTTQADTISTSFLNETLTLGDKSLHSDHGHKPSWGTGSSAPTQEQMNRRAERAKNRWKEPLEEGDSPIFGGRLVRCSVEEDPAGTSHRMRSDGGPALDTHDVFSDQVSTCQPDPDPTRLAREIMSPSIYSRDTDGISKHASSPASKRSHGETTVVITGREVRDVPIHSPQQSSHQRYVSQSTKEWQTWLAQEIGAFGLPNRDVSAKALDCELGSSIDSSSSVLDTPTAKSSHRRELTQISEDKDASQRMDDLTPRIRLTGLRSKRQHLNVHHGGADANEDTKIIDDRLKKPSRPKLRERTSSQMNERFPMMDTGQPFTRTDTTRGHRKPSFKIEGSPSPSPVPRSKIPKPTIPHSPEHEMNTLRRTPQSSSSLRYTSNYTQSNPSLPKAPPAKIASNVPHNASGARNQTQTRTKSTSDLRTNTLSSNVTLRRNLPASTHPTNSMRAHLASSSTTTLGKENTPSPSTPTTKTVVPWTREPNDSTPGTRSGRKVSATPPSSQSIRSRRIRASANYSMSGLRNSPASFSRDERAGEGNTTPVMLDKWLEERQRGSGTPEGLRVGRLGREASYAFL